ncbi:MAG TPA: TonB-dependent receptor [Thermoanaerobaculia bacterium]|nr:TonB-dependent receptor [Thermoanaerobaculia bacterium]
MGPALYGQQPDGAPPTVAAQVKYAGRPLAEVLRDLGALGLTVLFTGEVVKPEMRVRDEPVSSDPRRALDEVLAPHGLMAREGPSGVLVVVARAEAVESTASIQGEVLALGDAGSGVTGARLRLTGAREIDAAVDDSGRFSIDELPAGRYTLEASAEGFLAQRIEVSVSSGAQRRVVFHLYPQPFVEEEIVVRPSRLTLLEERPASAFAMSRDDIDRLPHLGGDVLRAASLLPGTAANDVTAQLSVHGGRRDEVSILLDGQELYEAFHLKDYDNALAVVPALALEGVTLSTGAYAASYGDRMSGVLDLRSAEPGSERRYLLSASVVDLIASASGGWGADGERDGGWLISGRRGSIDLASEFLGNEDPGFWDLLSKAEVGTGAGRFGARALISGDELELDEREGEDSFELLENDYESRYLWLTHEATPGDRLLVETSASVANVRRDRMGLASEEKGDFQVDDRRDLDVGGLGQTWTYDRGRNLVRGGFELRRYDALFDYAKHLDREFVILAPFSPPQPDEVQFDDVLTGDHVGAWASDRLQLFDRLSAELGLRWDHHEATDDTLWSPRLNVAWRLDDASVVRASWGRFFQSQRPYELQVEDGESALFPAELTEHSVLGYEAIFGGRGAGLQGLRIELFRRDVEDPRPRYENLLEPLEFLPEVEPDRVRITPEWSDTEGVELLVRARAGARLSGWLAYSYARAEDRIDGDRVPRSLDQPHAATLGADFRISARSSLVAAWRYRSGWPTTPVRSVLLPDPDDPDELENQLVFGRLNSERLGAYHRLDLRASHRVPLSQGSLLLFLDVQNVYDRANDAGFDVTIDDETGEVTREPEAWPGIFPSLGVVWEF